MGIAMHANVDERRLALARAKFEPLARMLDRLAKEIGIDHGRSTTLKQRGPMEPAAQNAFTARYSLQHPDEVRFALTFIVTGDNADLLLVQAQQHSGPRNAMAHPGQVDQRVYRLEEIDEISKVIREKISAHLRKREARMNRAA
jgi:hypothetical protein